MRTLFARVSSVAVIVLGLRAQDFHEFLPPGLLPEITADVRAVAAGDLDGDGDLDLVFGCHGQVGVGERNYWLRNDGTGTFGVEGREWIALAPSLTRAVACGDFDGDGDLDVIFGNQRLDTVCRNDGSGRLSLSAGDMPPVDRETNAFAVGDVDGDGDLDVVAACVGWDALYRNDGTGVFADATASLGPQAWSGSSDVDLADYDGDGDLDVLFAGSPARLLWNDGTGTFTASPFGFANGWVVSGGDVDGDGDRDFLLSGRSGSYGSRLRAQLYRNGGAAGFTVSEVPDPTSITMVWHAELVDMDVDGDLDVASDAGTLDNDGNGVFTWTGTGPGILGTFADLDGDGDPDVVDRTRGHRNVGGDVPSVAPDLDVPVDRLVHAFVDFDRDGDLDVVTSSRTGGTGWGMGIEVVANDSRGRFQGALAGHPVYSGLFPPAFGTADWTGDGWPDLLDGGAGRLLVNLAGQGLAAQQLPVPFAGSFATADFDRDGDLDLAAAAPNGTVVLRNDGSGGFVVTAGLPGGLLAAVDDAADFDRDGLVDLVLHVAGTPQIWRGDGSGGFAMAAGVLPSLGAVQCALARDLDGDGDVDLVLGHGWQANPRAVVLANDGTGHFPLAAPLPVDLGGVLAFAAADVDEDGDLDLAATGDLLGGHEPSRLLRNDGALVFADVTDAGTPWRGLPTEGGILHFGDIDADGDVDAVACPQFRARLLRNLRRETRARGLPEPGTNWRVDVHVRPFEGSLVGVLAGLRELAPSLPTPFGRLRIDPAVASGYGFFTSPAVDEPAGATLPIPPDPTLRGVQLFAQGVVWSAGEFRLANQVVDVVR